MNGVEEVDDICEEFVSGGILVDVVVVVVVVDGMESAVCSGGVGNGDNDDDGNSGVGTVDEVNVDDGSVGGTCEGAVDA